MKPLVFLIFFCTLGFAAQPARAVTYICKEDGKAVFSSDRINSTCSPSQMDGSGRATASKRPEEPPEQVWVKPSGARAAASAGAIWESEGKAAYNDIKVDNNAPVTSVTNTADAANPSVEIRLRNQKAKNKRKPAVVVPKVTTAPAQQQMSRNQILQNEIRTEQAALTRTRTQLSAARKKGDQAAAARLERAVRDREASIRAMKAEMKRY